MITIQASSIDELNIIWRRLRKDFQIIESIHLDPKTLQYRMVVNQPELTKMLRGVADKTLERMDLYQDSPLKGVMTVHQLEERIAQPGKFQSLEPVVKIWSLISNTDRKAIFAYLMKKVSSDQEGFDSDEISMEERQN